MENILTSERIVRFTEHLQSDEKAQNTIEKYHREVVYLKAVKVWKVSYCPQV